MPHFLGFLAILSAILIFIICFADGKGAIVRRKYPKGESHLLENLLNYNSYNILQRPIKKPTDRMKVSFGISLIRIVEVDHIFGVLTTSVWQTMEWTDWRLRWDPAEYSNITSVKIPVHRIWTPDIVPSNNGFVSYSPTFSTNVVVTSNGTATHVAPYRMATYCDLNPEAEEQRCSFHFGSWTYGVSELNLVMENGNGGDLSKYIPNNEWELLGDIPGVRSEKRNSWLPEPYVDITYILKFK